MKIPDKIKILGQEMTVELTHPRQIGIKGDYDERYNLIRIRHDKNIPLSQQEDTLLHEIFEAIRDLTCVTIDHATLSVIATVLYQVLRDNNLDFRKGKK